MPESYINERIEELRREKEKKAYRDYIRILKLEIEAAIILIIGVIYGCVKLIEKIKQKYNKI